MYDDDDDDDDDDLARLIRAADPARTPLTGALDERAENDLVRITGAPVRSREIATTLRARPVFIALPSAVALLLVVVLILQGWNLFGATTANKAAAVATPPLLASTPSPYTFGEVMRQAVGHLRDSQTESSAPGRHASYATWNLNVDVDFRDAPSSFISPEDVVMSWNADLSGMWIRKVGKSIATDTPPGPNEALPPHVGTVLRSDQFAAGEMGILNPTTPPTTREGALRYLQIVAGDHNVDPVDLVDAVQSVLNEWTLTSQQEAAMLSALKGLDGFTTWGGVTDRLGREGIAILARSKSNTHFESLLIISPSTGRVLSIETIYLGGINDLRKLPIPSVVNYTAWRTQ